MSEEDDAPDTKNPSRSSVSDNHLTPPAELTSTQEETDDFGLPKKDYRSRPAQLSEVDSDEEDGDTFHDAQDVSHAAPDGRASDEDDTPRVRAGQEEASGESSANIIPPNGNSQSTPRLESPQDGGSVPMAERMDSADMKGAPDAKEHVEPSAKPLRVLTTSSNNLPSLTTTDLQSPEPPSAHSQSRVSSKIRRERQSAGPVVSEWSHQRLAPQEETEHESEEEEEWKAMPALGEYEIYDDENRLVARPAPVEQTEDAGYAELGG